MLGLLWLVVGVVWGVTTSPTELYKLIIVVSWKFYVTIPFSYIIKKHAVSELYDSRPIHRFPSSFGKIVPFLGWLAQTIHCYILFLGRFPLSRFPSIGYGLVGSNGNILQKKILQTYHSFSFSSELFHPHDNTQYRFKSRITLLNSWNDLTSVNPKICSLTLFVLTAINISWNIESSIQNNKRYTFFPFTLK